jgi:hypothetical protein
LGGGEGVNIDCLLPQLYVPFFVCLIYRKEHEGCNNDSPPSWFIGGEHEKRNNDRSPSWSVGEEEGFLGLSSSWSIGRGEEEGM